MARVLTIFAAIAALAVVAAPAGAKPPAGFVGMVAEDVFAGASPYRHATLALHQRLGVQVIRQQFEWNKIERTPGQYDFAYYDRYILEAAHYGVRIVPVLFRPPAFRASAPHADGGAAPPDRYADMGTFGATIARRYGPGGTLWSQFPSARKAPIVSYQVWNEPNLPIYWPGGANAREYAKLLKATSRGIKRVTPKAEIITAGMPESKYPGAIPLLKYIKQLYRAGGKQAFDTVAINTYATDAKQLIKLLRSVRATMNRHGDRRAKIWASEFGWADSGPKSRFRVGPRKQARNISASINAMGKHRRSLRLSGFVYWNWKDAPPYRAGFDFWGLHAGLLRQDGTPKPAFTSFVQAVQKLK